MERQHLSQTKNSIALPQTQSHAIARSSAHPIEELQGAIGNQAVNKLLVNQPIVQAKPMFWGLSHELAIQPKLTIGEVGDKYEQEADRLASQVVEQINAPSAAQPTQGQSLQRQKDPVEELQAKPSISVLQRSALSTQVQLEAMPEEEELQAKSILQRQEAIAGGEASTDLASAINSARGGGQPLDAGLQRSMGQAMGADFSGVKVHTDTQSDRLNRSIQAKAFTTGQDVFFRQGAYQPGSHGGQELIAHELTHVRQQGYARHDGQGAREKGKPHKIQRFTQLEYTVPLTVDETAVVKDMEHTREAHTPSAKDRAAQLSGYENALDARANGCGVCNHSISYSDLTDAIREILDGTFGGGVDLKDGVTQLEAIKIGKEDFDVYSKGTKRKLLNNVHCAAIPQLDKTKFETAIGSGTYKSRKLEKEIDDVIVNLANDPRNLFYWPANAGDNRGRQTDKPVGKGPINLTDRQSILDNYAQELRNNGIPV